jgi:glutathione S-transferase
MLRITVQASNWRSAIRMKLYFSPLACSMATRIAMYDFGVDAQYVEVDSKTKLTAEGGDFRNVHSLGLVPVLVTDDERVLTENAAILQYVAEEYGKADLGGEGAFARAQLRQYLCFIGTELHKGLYVPLLDPKAPDSAKAYALTKAESRLGWVADRLAGRDYLLSAFSVADAYLFTVLNWSRAVPVDLKPFASIGAFMERMRERPSVARAVAEELALYQRAR